MKWRIAFSPWCGRWRAVTAVVMGAMVACSNSAVPITQGEMQVEEEGPPSLAFWSDWRTATGASPAAYLDGGKWDGAAASTGDVVEATGLGFPSGMRNVFRSGYPSPGGSVSTCDRWPLPEVGRQVVYRLYIKHAVHVTENKDPDPHHPIQSDAGDAAHVWHVKWGVRDSDDAMVEWFLGGDGMSTLNLLSPVTFGSVVRLEFAFERVGNDQWRKHVRIYDAANDEIFRADETGTSNGLLAETGGLVCGTLQPLRSLFLGWNGPTDWFDNISGFVYFGGVATALLPPNRFIGPYPVGPEGN